MIMLRILFPTLHVMFSAVPFSRTSADRPNVLNITVASQTALGLVVKKKEKKLVASQLGRSRFRGASASVARYLVAATGAARLSPFCPP
ncbi:hypothetical protein BD289DRAFT_428165 [Coniella lustricola]|uniref:Secreted protein n=1 Tax=Coniella lustricola TaxID=2025994 RepID=A0A2T3AED0_9PEZI|nr:hypothetical protein BD289DRAFT_428165 [Coniella lustricola]